MKLYEWCTVRPAFGTVQSCIRLSGLLVRGLVCIIYYSIIPKYVLIGSLLQAEYYKFLAPYLSGYTISLGYPVQII